MPEGKTLDSRDNKLDLTNDVDLCNALDKTADQIARFRVSLNVAKNYHITIRDGTFPGFRMTVDGAPDEVFVYSTRPLFECDGIQCVALRLAFNSDDTAFTDEIDHVADLLIIDSLKNKREFTTKMEAAFESLIARKEAARITP
jgi:hypothetical protein